jgi:hypothetical protein
VALEVVAHLPSEPNLGVVSRVLRHLRVVDVLPVQLAPRARSRAAAQMRGSAFGPGLCLKTRPWPLRMVAWKQWKSCS